MIFFLHILVLLDSLQSFLEINLYFFRRFFFSGMVGEIGVVKTAKTGSFAFCCFQAPSACPL